MKLKKIISAVAVSSIILFSIYFFFLKSYTNVLHTSVDLNAFSKDENGILDIVEWYKETYHISAVSMAIIKKEAPVQFFSTGNLSKKVETPVDEYSIYRIASTGKMMLGLIAKQLQQEGLVDLKESMVTYLGDLLDDQAEDKWRDVRLEHLLFHNSGLGRDWKGFSKADIIQNLNHKALTFPTGEKWVYSNFGYATLALIFEEATGLDYHQLLDKYVVKAFHLTEMSTTLNEPQRYVTPYLPELKLLKGEDIDYGKQTLASGIYTNVKTLSELMLQQIAAYQQADSLKQNSPLILNAEKINTWSDQSFYGYGIFEHHFELDQVKGIRQVKLEHGGDANGFACAYEFFPELGLGVVLLTSSGGYWFQDMTRKISDLLVLDHFQGQ